MLRFPFLPKLVQERVVQKEDWVIWGGRIVHISADPSMDRIVQNILRNALKRRWTGPVRRLSFTSRDVARRRKPRVSIFAKLPSQAGISRTTVPKSDRKLAARIGERAGGDTSSLSRVPVATEEVRCKWVA